MEFSLLLPLVNFKLILSKQQKVVSWRFDVTTDELEMPVKEATRRSVEPCHYR